MRFFIYLFLCCFVASAQADFTPPDNQEKIKLRDVVTEMPQTAWDSIKYSFTKDSIPVWAAIVTSTAVLYHYDQDIYVGAMNDGNRWNLGNQDNTKTVISGAGFDLLRLPTDLASGMYFLGDGWTHTTIALSFLGTGYFGDHNRAYNTGLEIIHGMVVSTVFSQALKRSFGRQSPNHSTEPRGKWQPFPSIAAYGKDTPSYDAFPSGHIMTATLTFTIIQNNYPEYFWYTTPIETLWLGALMFEMMNNGVHWASDYPLGIAMGYVVAKASTQLGVSHKKDGSGKSDKKSAWDFYPGMDAYGTTTMNAMYEF